MIGGDVANDFTGESLARLFHETYERLAPSFDYETREASAVQWDDVPEPNRSLMVAVAREVLGHIHIVPGPSLRMMADDAEVRLREAVADSCPGPHQPIQHRDGRPPWCATCRRTERGIEVQR